MIGEFKYLVSPEEILMTAEVVREKIKILPLLYWGPHVILKRDDFSSYFPTKIYYASFISPKRASCPAHLILRDLFALIKCGGQQRL
jgi:hypothetical protein